VKRRYEESLAAQDSCHCTAQTEPFAEHGICLSMAATTSSGADTVSSQRRQIWLFGDPFEESVTFAGQRQKSIAAHRAWLPRFLSLHPNRDHRCANDALA
jgi:hypothetical protein